jgi:hypothetical protein
VTHGHGGERHLTCDIDRHQGSLRMFTDNVHHSVAQRILNLTPFIKGQQLRF